MKFHIPIYLLVAGMLAGCVLDDVLDFGDPCPPRDEKGDISYIGSPYCTMDQLDRCDVKHPVEYFKAKTCPRLYNVCVPNEFSEGYHCESEKKIITECAFNEIKCDIDPEDSSKGFSCINPADTKTCGASSCSEFGFDCSMIDSRSRCLYDKKKGYYCGCPEGDIACDGRCVTPSSSGTHCGARGACTSPDFASDDFKGDNCEEGYSFCRDGKCTCGEGKVWCKLNGQPGCYDPKDSASCNVHVMADGITCEAYTCQDGYSCEILSADAYACQLSQCGKNKQMCPAGDGKKTCVSLLDPRFCGSCINDCNDYPFEHARAKSCELNPRDIPTCHFDCEDGYVNCGTELAPRCIRLDSVNNCGECGKACKNKEICENGECIKTTCSDKQCTVLAEGGNISCVSSDTQCGINCADCTKMHANGFCKDGACVISACSEDEHPIFSGTDIIQCEKNSSKVCASKDLQPGQPVVDCTAELPSAVSVVCTSEGKCVISECPSGQHIASDRRSCVANSTTLCGASNSTQTVNCSSQIGNASGVKCQNDGTCSVVSCNSNFHISADGRACAANTNEACGSSESTYTTNCTHGIQKICSDGRCACSEDGSTVLNFDKNACVIAACRDIPGVQVGSLLDKSWYNPNYSEYACNPVQCVAGYKQVSQGGSGKYFSCLPPGGNAGTCNPLGYKYWASGYCVGREKGTGYNGHNHCASDYRQYIQACIHKDLCCGTRNLDMSKASDYLCTNCRALGKTCNMNTGQCQ